MSGHGVGIALAMAPALPWAAPFLPLRQRAHRGRRGFSSSTLKLYARMEAPPQGIGTSRSHVWTKLLSSALPDYPM